MKLKSSSAHPLVIALLCALVPWISSASADTVRVALWNLDGPNRQSGHDQDLVGFGTFVDGSDAIVLVETISEDQLKDMKDKASLSALNHAISDFAKDSESNPYYKLEVGVLTPHRIGTFREADPDDENDTPDMQALDEDIDVPDWLPADQRSKTGHRGWIWVELPDLKLVVVAVHLKSSRGDGGRDDEENAMKRETIAASLGVVIREDAARRLDWSYIVAGDFNVAPGDIDKIGYDLTYRCPAATSCRGYDQTHALLTGGLVHGLAMRNLTVGLGSTFADRKYVDSPIDNILAMGPIFNNSARVTAEKGPLFGSDHHAVRVTVE